MTETQATKRLTAQLNLRIDPEEVAALERIKSRTGESQSETLRRLIRDEAARLGLAATPAEQEEKG